MITPFFPFKIFGNQATFVKLATEWKCKVLTERMMPFSWSPQPNSAAIPRSPFSAIEMFVRIEYMLHVIEGGGEIMCWCFKVGPAQGVHPSTGRTSQISECLINVALQVLSSKGWICSERSAAGACWSKYESKIETKETGRRMACVRVRGVQSKWPRERDHAYSSAPKKNSRITRAL